MSKTFIYFSPYFPAFGLNTYIYSVNPQGPKVQKLLKVSHLGKRFGTLSKNPPVMMEKSETKDIKPKGGLDQEDVKDTHQD